LLKLLDTGCADGKKRLVPAPLRGMDDGPGQGCMDWHCLAVVMKSFSKTQGKQCTNMCARPAMERSAVRFLLHSLSLRPTSCLPTFII